ncbi:MAG: hypothetical protein ACTSQG_00225 [Promethearchaeota archaeon]
MVTKAINYEKQIQGEYKMENQSVADLHRGAIPTNLIRDDLLKDGFEILSINKCKECHNQIINVKYRKETGINSKKKPKYSIRFEWQKDSNQTYSLCNPCDIKKQEEDRQFSIKSSIESCYIKIFRIREKIKKIKKQNFKCNEYSIENVIGIVIDKDYIIVDQLDKDEKIKHFIDKNKIEIFTTNSPIQKILLSDDDCCDYESNVLHNFDEEKEYGTKKIKENYIEETDVYKKYKEEFPSFFNEDLYKENYINIEMFEF